MYQAIYQLSSKIVFCLCMLATMVAARAETVDPEWPCVQALIPQVELAIMWPEPLAEPDKGKWRSDDTIAALARTLGDLEAYTENEEKMIDDFAAAQSTETMKDSLSQLAEGVVTEANRIRSQYIRGIKRYTRQQISIASQIEEGLNQLASMEESTGDSPAANENSQAKDQPAEDRAELEESLKWHERVYDQREQAIVSLCERPVELEEKLSSVLRHLSTHLP